VKRWWGHLRAKVLAFGIVMSVMPLAIFGWFGITATESAQMEIVQTQNRAAATTVADELSRFMRDLKMPLGILAGTYGADLLRADGSEQERLLYTLLRDVPYLEEVALLDSTGLEHARVSRREITTGAEPAQYGGAPLWPKLAKGGPALSSVTLDVDGRPLMQVGVPLPDRSGALIARASLRGVFANIAAVRGAGGVRIHVADESGRLIGDSDFSLVLAGNQVPLPSDNDTPYRSVTGEEALGISAPVPELLWHVVAETPLDIAMAPVHRLGWEFGSGALALMTVVVVLSVIFGLQLAEPLERLEAGAKRVGTGDFSGRIPEGGRDELGRLASAFNAMTERLAIARQSEKLVAVGQLAAGVAHEINNPLAVIAAYAEDLADRLAEEGTAALEQEGVLGAYLAELQHQVRRCKGITRNLLDFARQGATESEPVDVGEIARQTVTLAGSRARKAGVAVRVDAEPGLPPVQATRDQLQQVFLNLIANAMDAIPGPGEICVTARRSGSTVNVSVADTGCGMDAATVARATEPFFTTKPPGKGTGLGLSICYGIITGLGGRMDLTSRPGQGTVVTFDLPVWEESSCAPTHS
jgi:two-component system NtrC family sensor kinase